MQTPSNTQLAKANAFKALHERDGIFVIPNPWDAGSAKMLQSLGYEALATTSAGFAFSLGRPDGDGDITRDETFENVRAIVAATSLPVSADLENGYGDTPEACAETILLAAEAGLVGCSIEDATGRKDEPIYAFELAVERIKAAVRAARSLPHPFMLTARAENLIRGGSDLKDTINRLVAFADAGADVLYAPGLKTKDDITALVKAVAPKAVNVVMGLGTVVFTLQELEDLGVRRVSLGASLARAAYSAFMYAAKEVKEQGIFTFAQRTIPYADMNAMFR